MPDPFYANLVLGLSERASLQHVAEELRADGIEPAELSAAFAAAVAEAQAEGRPAQHALLVFLRRFAEGVLSPAPPDAALPIDAPVLEALRRAGAAASPLAAYRALAAVGAGLTAETFDLVERSRLPAGGIADSRTAGLLHAVALASGRPPLRVRALLLAARRFVEDQRYTAARTMYRRAVRVADRAGDPELQYTAAVLYAEWFMMVEHLPGAVEWFERAFAIRDGLPQDEYPDVGVLPSRRAQALAYRAVGRYRDALEVVDTALATSAEARDVTALARQHGLAVPATDGWERSEFDLRVLRVSLLDDLDDPEAAAAGSADLIARAESTGRRDAVFQALTLAGSGAEHRHDFAAAEGHYRRTLALGQRWGSASTIASAFNNLGNLYLTTGRAERAYQAFVSAVWHAGEAGAPMPTVGIALIGLGDAWTALDNPGAAESAYLYAIERSASNAGLLLILAIRLAKLGPQWQERAAVVFEQHIGSELTPATAVHAAAGTYAFMLAEAGELDRAVDVLRRGQAAIGRTAPDAPDRAALRLDLGTLLARRSETAPEAYATLSELVATQQRRIDDAQSGERRSELVADLIRGYGALIGLLVEHGAALPDPGDPELRAFALHEAAKARSLGAQLGRAPLPLPDGVPADLAGREARLLELAESARRGGPASGHPGAERRRALDAELHACWERMRPHAEHYVRMRMGEPVAPAQVVEVLEGMPYRVALASFFCDRDTTTCFVLRSGEPPAVTRAPIGRDTWAEAGAALRRQFNGARRSGRRTRRSAAPARTCATCRCSTGSAPASSRCWPPRPGSTCSASPRTARCTCCRSTPCAAPTAATSSRRTG
ncbi:hypothetical protein [Dactylosporangium sp. NPDC051541]|uniref:hypothetical protein n=1 Tax=Dactylosporangium sp. NPDC051541 TaxID=3363977 RepID=UPI00378FB923